MHKVRMRMAMEEKGMSGRIFQNVVLQLKEASDRVVGVIDSEGTVISCSDLGLIGRKWPEYVERINQAEGVVIVMDGRAFRSLPIRLRCFHHGRG